MGMSCLSCLFAPSFKRKGWRRPSTPAHPYLRHQGRFVAPRAFLSALPCLILKVPLGKTALPSSPGGPAVWRASPAHVVPLTSPLWLTAASPASCFCSFDVCNLLFCPAWGPEKSLAKSLEFLHRLWLGHQAPPTAGSEAQRFKAPALLPFHLVGNKSPQGPSFLASTGA